MNLNTENIPEELPSQSGLKSTESFSSTASSESDDDVAVIQNSSMEIPFGVMKKRNDQDLTNGSDDASSYQQRKSAKYWVSLDNTKLRRKSASWWPKSKTWLDSPTSGSTQDLSHQFSDEEKDDELKSGITE